MTAEQTSFFVDNGDVRLAVFEEGNLAGETLVLVHGWPDTHELWQHVIPFLADRFRLVSYDSRGAGASTIPQKVAGYRLEEMAKDFFAVLDAVSPDKPVHVLAHDWGSVEVWEAVVAEGAEDRIASFTSVSGPNLDYLGQWAREGLLKPTPGNLAGPLSQLASSWYTGLFQLPLAPEFVLRNVASKIWPRFVGAFDGIDHTKVTPAATLAEDMANGVNLYRANIAARLAVPRKRTTEVPVQLVVNKRDLAVRPSGYNDYGRYAKNLWRREVRSGHWLPYGNPELLARLTVEFIDMLGGDAPSISLRRAKVGPVRKELTDELVVVTGAGSGIGRETAFAFGRLGAEVVVADIDLESAKETVALLENEGLIGTAYQLDVADEAKVEEFADWVKETIGVPSVVVNNAGIGFAGPFFETSAAEFDKVMAVNLGGVASGCRHFGKMMAAQAEGGHIVNISSLAAFTPQKMLSAYATSKAAVYMLSDCVRAELAADGVGVSTICPGVVATNITANTPFAGLSAAEQAKKQQDVTAMYKLRNYTPDRVAKQIVGAVRGNRAVVSVTPEAKLGRFFAHVAPAAVRFSAKVGVI